MATTQINGNKQIQAGTIQDSNIAAIGTPAGYLGITTAKLADQPTRGFWFADGSAVATAAFRMGSATPATAVSGVGTNFIQCLTDPVNSQDAATKNYVDGKVSGLASSAVDCKAASTSNLTLSGTQSIDGVACNAGDLVLVKDQTTTANNGIYTVATGAWTRIPQMSSWAQVPGLIAVVEMGTTQHDTLWLSTADPGGSMGTTPITFVQIPGPSDIQAGAGLSRVGQALNVVAADTSMAITGSAPGGGTIAVKLDPARAVTLVSGQGIGANVDGTTITISANKITLVPNLFLAASNTIIRETPMGAIDGVNAVFTLVSTPNPANYEQIFLNGILQEPGAGNDYTISTNTITFATAPPLGSRIKANYYNRSAAPA